MIKKQRQVRFISNFIKPELIVDYDVDDRSLNFYRSNSGNVHVALEEIEEILKEIKDAK